MATTNGVAPCTITRCVSWKGLIHLDHPTPTPEQLVELISQGIKSLIAIGPPPDNSEGGSVDERWLCIYPDGTVKQIIADRWRDAVAQIPGSTLAVINIPSEWYQKPAVPGRTEFDSDVIADGSYFEVAGLTEHVCFPYYGVQFDQLVHFMLPTGQTRDFRIITHQAYGTGGLIACEFNGVAVVDVGSNQVLCDRMESTASAYNGVGRNAWRLAHRLAFDMSWEEFRQVVTTAKHIKSELVV